MNGATGNAVAAWLRRRHPNWDDAAVSWSITRSYVIDDHPNWDDARIDREVGRQLGTGRKVKGELP